MLAMSHSDICYSRQYKRDNLGIEIAKPLRLASCMVIEDADGKVLVTKRSRKMRVFPRAWVLPGGHIDAGETLEQGVVREVFEETGIDILIEQVNKQSKFTYQGQQVSLKPYFVYESSIS